MMKTKPRIFYLLLLPPLLFAACRGSEDESPFLPQHELPPITTTGENKFGCLLNGEVWVNTPHLLHDNVTVEYSSHWEMFDINAKRANPSNLSEDLQGISFSSEFIEEGIHQFSGIGYLYPNDPPCGIGYILREDVSDEINDEHFLKITRLDTQERIVAGQFAFVLIDTLCQDTLRFTEGRFDYHY